MTDSELTTPPLTLEDIDKRLNLLRACQESLDIGMEAAGQLYRGAINDIQREPAWGTMYVIQVYMHGVLDEIKGLEKKKEEIHNDSSGTDSEAKRV